MKKNFTLNALFVFAMIIAALAGNVSARTEKNCASGKSTVAFAPEASAGVVINEVYGGSETGGIYNADFIELYNLSAVAVDISDYSVQYYTAGQINAGAPTSTAHIPAATILQPFSYYVIRVSPDNRPGSALPCVSLNASASFAETGIASEGGKLVLSSTGADLDDCTSTSSLVVDRVGYGDTPVVCNETFNAAQPSTSTSVQRRAGSTADTDNNNTDFTAIGPPTPCTRLTTTAAMVSVGGRVTNSSDSGIGNVVISMTDSNGATRTATTDSFGYYSFADVPARVTIILTVKGKHFTFSQPTQVLNIIDDVEDINFVGSPARRMKEIRKIF
jgi:uncharacterized protein YcnI